MKTSNLVGIIAVTLAIAGLVITLGQFFENKYIGWAFIATGLALAVINTWYNIRKHRRR
jgi:uncharacterized membrane protein